MNNMFFNDDDAESTNEHWKNSEVLRIFAEIYQPPQQAIAIEEQPVSSPELQESQISSVLEAKAAAEALEGKVKTTIQRLERLAYMYGDEPEIAYAIERTINEIKSINGEE